MSSTEDCERGGRHLSVPTEEPTSVLLLGSTLDGGVDEACAGLLSVTDPGRTDYLAVSLSGSADGRLDHWRRHVSPELPAKVGVVATSEPTRGAAAAADNSASAAALPAGPNVRFSPVSSPSDLTGLGIQIGECVSAWAGDGNRTVVCFDSLTTVLQCAELQRTFRFVHVLLERLRSAGAFAHFHLDPRAHDDRTLATLRSLFDWVVEAGPDGELHER